MALARVEFDVEEMHSRLLASLRDEIDGFLRYNYSLLSFMCESPIEVALGTAFMVADRMNFASQGLSTTVAWAFDEKSYRADSVLLIPQFPWKGYRIDFALRVPTFRKGFLFIECDGHDFHERTKEQAARDRSKDRLIQQEGYPILRFTGSEIHRDAAACARQIFEFVGQNA